MPLGLGAPGVAVAGPATATPATPAPAMPAPAPAAPTDTHCPYCALQCATTLIPDAGGLRVAGRDFPTNRGGLCQKGWTAPAVLRAADRLTAPLLRGADGELHPASWDDALGTVAAGLARLQREAGADAVAVFGGGGLTNEKAYALGMFARAVLRTSRIDYNGRFCMSSAAAAGNRAFGVDRGLPFPLADVGGADAVLLVGSNLAETMPPACAHLTRARQRGGLIVIDPRRTATAALAEDDGGLHLQNVPGTDLAVVLGLLHVVVHESLLDAAYVAARTTGFDVVRAAVNTWWPERAEAVTGVPAPVLRGAARRLAAAAPAHGGCGAYVLTGRGAEQHTNGTDTVTACIDLALALGLPGRAGSGYGCLTGQGNGQGGREHGQKADQLPGYRLISDPAARAHVAPLWRMAPEELPGPGLSAVELLAAIGTPGGPRALLVHGSNLVVSAPRALHVGERLRALDLLVVCDVVPSETALLADVVLPVTQWAEEEGTLTTLEGRVVRRRRAVPAPPDVRDELAVLADLADRLGRPGLMPRHPAEAFDQLRAASAGGPADYSGITYARLDAGEALHWPCPARPDGERPHPGTPRLFLDRFATTDGRARFVAVDHRPPADDLRPDAPVHLVTGRVLQHYQSGAQTRRVDELARAVPEPFVELHPDLAERLGVEPGDEVRVRSARGTAVAVARITETVRPDTVFMPFHWSGPGSANALTNDALDPISRMPEFKVCAVSVERAGPDREAVP
ncbi:MAG TPA: molybdopterin oxidoreductase family protein [Kineosporiaceae bacterium]